MSGKCPNARDQSLEQQVRTLYTELALNWQRDFGWGKGKDNARALGYDPAWLERLPEVVWESAAAVGTPSPSVLFAPAKPWLTSAVARALMCASPRC